MPPTVSKLKGKKIFSVKVHMLRQTLCRLPLHCPFHLPFPSFSDVAEARSYVADTVTNDAPFYVNFSILLLLLIILLGSQTLFSSVSPVIPFYTTYTLVAALPVRTGVTHVSRPSHGNKRLTSGSWWWKHPKKRNAGRRPLYEAGCCYRILTSPRTNECADGKMGRVGEIKSGIYALRIITNMFTFRWNICLYIKQGMISNFLNKFSCLLGRCFFFKL
jgi:hypothetical protein